MAENKTKPTGASIEAYLDARASAEQRADCLRLIALLKTLTGQPPKLWGPSIVGHGVYRYTYESGRTGEAPLAGFAISGREIVVYLAMESAAQQALLAKLGPHRAGKVCLYIKRLADLDEAVLEKLIAVSVADVRRRYYQTVKR